MTVTKGKFVGYCPKCKLMLADPMDLTVSDFYACPQCGEAAAKDALLLTLHPEREGGGEADVKQPDSPVQG